MWRLLGILALVICAEAMPKKYAGIPLRKPSGLKASDTDNRLNTTLAQPSNYKLDLTVTQDNLNNGNFSGTVQITLNFGVDAINSFQIHAKELEIIGDITLTKTGFVTDITYDGPDSNNFLTISSSKPIPSATDYILTISYTGKLSDTDMEGFYRSSYKDDKGNTKYLATTQFEQMGARRAFPCFDEPALKASFDITITYPNTSIALSNTAQKAAPTPDKDGLNKVTFKTTPQMSTYLVAFIVSEFECSVAETTDPVPSSVCARSGNTNTIKVALDTAPKALNEMNTYTKHTYKELGNDKMTQVAIPDFAAGAMENWGLVTYREADLLWDETESSNYYKQAVVTVVSHELSHQWFGDFVTLDWWSNVFLNEGFATYFEYYAAAKIQTSWELEKQFVIDQVQPVLVTDSVNDSRPLSYNSNDPDVINSRFDDIAYNKGGTVIRMLQNFVGLENFEKGLSVYLDKGLIGTPYALWTSFNDFKSDDIPANVEEIMDNWTKKAGYPLLTLKQDGINVTITQERFLLSNDTDETQWYVPITYTTSNDTTQFTETATKVWLKPNESLTITLDNEDDWIILNNQQVGYYRVDYDETLLKKIKTALDEDDFGNIDEISRSQLVDDQLNLARAGKKEYKEVLEFLGFLKKDESYYSWSSAFNGFSYLLKRTNDDNVKKFLKTYIIELMDALLKDVPVTTENKDNQIYTLKQVLALTWSCNLEDKSCVDDARERFVNYISNDAAPSSNLKSIVYCNGLRQSENASGEYNILLNKYTSTKLATEQVTILKALGCVNDATIRQEYLKEALDENVRLQDARHVFESVYSNNGAEGVNDVVQFIIENYKDFETHFGSQSTLYSLIGKVADLFTSQEQIDKLKTFLDTEEGLDANIKSSGDAAVASATNNLVAIKSLEDTLKDYFKTDNGSAAMTTYHFVTLGLIGIVYLMFNF